MKCFRCGSKLEIEYEKMEADYPLVCHKCNENMFIFESIEEYEGECLDMYHYIPLIKNGLLNGVGIMKKNTVINLNVNEIAETIAFELMYEWDTDTKKVKKVKRIDIDSLDKDCYLAIADIKGEIFDKAVKIIEKENIKLN